MPASLESEIGLRILIGRFGLGGVEALSRGTVLFATRQQQKLLPELFAQRDDTGKPNLCHELVLQPNPMLPLQPASIVRFPHYEYGRGDYDSDEENCSHVSFVGWSPQLLTT